MGEMLYYHIRLVRYATQAQIKSISTRYDKICGKKKLEQLVQLGQTCNGILYLIKGL